MGDTALFTCVVGACLIVSDDVFCMLVSHCNTAQRTRATSLLLGCPFLLFPVIDLLETRGAWVCDPSASGRLHKGRIDDLSLLGALGAWCSVRVGACLCAHVCVSIQHTRHWQYAFTPNEDPDGIIMVVPLCMPHVEV